MAGMGTKEETAHMINLINNMENEELIEYLVESLGDEVDSEQIRKGMSGEQIEEYRRLIIDTMKENDGLNDDDPVDNIDKSEKNPDEERESTSLENTEMKDDRMLSDSTTENVVTSESKDIIEVITLSDDNDADKDSLSAVCEVLPVQKVTDFTTTIARNLDNFSVSGITEIDEADESPCQTVRKVSTDQNKISITVFCDGGADVAAASSSQQQQGDETHDAEYFGDKIKRWTQDSQKQIASPGQTVVDIPENEEEDFYSQLLNYNNNNDDDSDDDQNALDNLSLPSGGKLDFTVPNNAPNRDNKTSDPAKDYEYCGAGLLSAKIRVGGVGASGDEEEQEEGNFFKNIFDVIRGYERHNFQAKCNLCDELVTDQKALGLHVNSASHRRNLVGSSLKLIGLEPKFSPSPSVSSSSPKIGRTTESSSVITESIKNISHSNVSSSHNKENLEMDQVDDNSNGKEEPSATEVGAKEEATLTKEDDEKNLNLDVLEKLSTNNDKPPSPVPEEAVSVRSSSGSKKDGKELPLTGSVHSSHPSVAGDNQSNSRSNSQTKKSRSRSGDTSHKEKEDRRSRSKSSHRHKDPKRARRQSKPRSSSSSRAVQKENNKNHHHPSSSRGSHKVEDSQSRRHRRTMDLTLDERVEFYLDKYDKRSSSSTTNALMTEAKKSHKDDKLTAFLQTAETKQNDTKLFQEKLALIANGKWTDELEQNWKRMEVEQKDLMRSLAKIRGRVQDKLQGDAFYEAEWTKFWEKRYEQLVVDDNRSIAYADSYDYTPEWMQKWVSIVAEMLQEKYKEKLQTIRLKYGLDLDTLKSLNTPTAPPVIHENNSNNSHQVHSNNPANLPPPVFAFHGQRHYFNPRYPPPHHHQLPPPPGVSDFVPEPMYPMHEPPPYQYQYPNSHYYTQYPSDPRAPWGYHHQSW